MALEGQRLGRYHIVRLLGSGGMGEVYLAEDPRIGQQVAIKVVRAEMDDYPGTPSVDEAARLFLREAQAIVALDHPAILPLHEYGETQIGQMHLTFLVMPYRKEGSLAAWVRRQAQGGILPPTVVAHLVNQAAEALQHAHDHGVIHQDIKPANFLLRARTPDTAIPDVLLADFGIARLTAAAASTSQAIRGTPTYMAPEQCLGKPVMASDQYALAVMAYVLLTGHPPFQGNQMQIMYHHVHTLPEAPSAHRPGLSRRVDEVLLTALSKHPEERFKSVTAFATAFQNAVQTMEAEGAQTRISPVQEPKITSILPGSPLISHTLANAPTYITPPAEEATPPLSESLAEEAQTPAPLWWTAASTGPTAPPLPETADLGKHREGDIAQPAAAPGWTEEGEPPTAPPLPETLSLGSAYAAGLLEAGTRAEPAPAGLTLASVLPGPIIPSGRRHLRRPRWLFIAAAVLVILALVGSGLAYTLIYSTAAVTIRPKSREVSNTYTISAVTGTPDASKQEVQARMLSVTTPAQTKTVAGTGHASLPASHASGWVRFNNYVETANAQFYTGETFSNQSACDASGHITIVIDGNLSIPPATGPSPPYPSLLVRAHVLQSGAGGNFPPRCDGIKYWFLWRGSDGSCVSGTGGPCWDAYNTTSFTGGQDAYDGPVVNQSDIDGATNSLISANQPDPQQILQAQMQQDEQLVGTPQCTPKKSANHKAGDKVAAVTVSVSFLCTGEVYDHDGAVQMAEQLLVQQAATDPGGDYALMGSIKTAITAVPADDRGTMTLTVSVEGLWAYQFSEAQLQTLARVIAGKRAQDAQRILTSQVGVSQATIKLPWGFGQTLPSDPARIRIAVQEPEA